MVSWPGTRIVWSHVHILMECGVWRGRWDYRASKSQVREPRRCTDYSGRQVELYEPVDLFRLLERITYSI